MKSNHNLSEDELKTSYIDENGKIFTPCLDKSAKEVYKKWLNDKDKQTVSEQEKLNAKLLQQNAEIQIQLEEQKAFNAQILLQLAGSDTNV